MPTLKQNGEVTETLVRRHTAPPQHNPQYTQLHSAPADRSHSSHGPSLLCNTNLLQPVQVGSPSCFQSLCKQIANSWWLTFFFLIPGQWISLTFLQKWEWDVPSCLNLENTEDWVEVLDGPWLVTQTEGGSVSGAGTREELRNDKAVCIAVEGDRSLGPGARSTRDAASQWCYAWDSGHTRPAVHLA